MRTPHKARTLSLPLEGKGGPLAVDEVLYHFIKKIKEAIRKFRIAFILCLVFRTNITAENQTTLIRFAECESLNASLLFLFQKMVIDHFLIETQ